jgi:ADP-ribosylglycohydrolase
MNITWIRISELLEHEIRQRMEEGRREETIEAAWASARREATGPTDLEARAEGIWQQMESSPLAPKRSAGFSLEAIRAACPNRRQRLNVGAVSEATLRDKVAGGWFGRAAGCLLGKPVEKTPREGIRELLESNRTWPIRDYITGNGIPAALAGRYPWNRHSGRESLRENIVCMPEDDDMNYPMLNLTVLERHGTAFTTDDIAAAWLEFLPVLSTFTAERVAYRNLLLGLRAPDTALRRNPFREWIGAQIRADLWGWISPGEPERAAEMAYRDASLSHTGNGVYASMFVAATLAAAFATDDAREAVVIGLSQIPGDSRLADAIRFSLGLPKREPEWERAVDDIYERYGSYHWVHSINNAALVVAALLYADGDFGKAVCNVVMGGWDTDSNGATVGSIAGVLLGRAALPAQWIDPLHDRIRSSMKGFDGSALSVLADRTFAQARNLAP